jgi:hypothetical protein
MVSCGTRRFIIHAGPGSINPQSRALVMAENIRNTAGARLPAKLPRKDSISEKIRP